MIDIRHIRENPEIVKAACINKKANVSAHDVDRLIELDDSLRDLENRVQELRRQRNELSAVRARPSDEQILLAKDIKEALTEIEPQYDAVKAQWGELIRKMPNIPSADTPIGKSEDDNVVLRQVGSRREFDFTPKPHWELGQALGLIDNERAAKVSGSRFTYLKGNLAKLQFALIQFTISRLTDPAFTARCAASVGPDVDTKPFEFMVPPVMVRRSVMARMARLDPVEDRYQVSSEIDQDNAGNELFLVGSAEHTLGPYFMDEHLAEEDLPIRFLGYSSSFRQEAGTYGRDMRGILRLHQFDKLEMESFCVGPIEKSAREHDFFVAVQEALMVALELPYQVVAISTGDMGTPDARQRDIETWMPGQDAYRETHTADLMTDYQSRRLGTRVKLDDGATEFVHMVDATAFAVGRTLVAIMENNQHADGSITVPIALQPLYGGTSL